MTLWYRADLPLYLKNMRNVSLLQPYSATSSWNTKFPWHFPVKLFENKFYHHKSLCKLEKMLKNVTAILFDYLLQKSLSNRVIQIKVTSFIMPYWHSCLFQQILETMPTLKITSVSFNIILFVRNLYPNVSSFYYNVIQYISRTSFLKMEISQNNLITST